MRLRDTYIEVDNGVMVQIYGVLQLRTLYLHKAIALSIGDAYAISKYLDIYFIDAHGTVLARYCRSHTV